MANDRDAWDRLWSDLETFRSTIGRSKAVNVNTARLRDQAQSLVQLYFREARPELVELGLTDLELEALDSGAQALLRLSHGSNPKTSYARVLQSLRRLRSPLAALRERRLSQAAVPTAHGGGSYSSTEQRVVATLKAMLPEAAASYEQAVVDLMDGPRLSWRGTAVELREVVREVLDHLAPDEAVSQEGGFKLERDRVAPTMRQKASFVLRSRGLSAKSRKAPQEATTIVDELTASFVRSTYERGSASTHGAPSKEDVERLKMYVDTVLLELLETRGTSA